MRRLTVLFVAAFALVAMAAAAFALAGPVATQGKQTARATTNVTVHMGEYYYTLDKTEAPTGTVIFTIINDGDVGHDFLINGQKIPVIEKGQTAKLTVNFNTPSTGQGIEYQCTVGEHAIYGMRGFFKITGAPIGGGGGGGGTTPFKPKTTLRATLSEFKITLRTLKGKAVKSIPAGKTRFLVKNTGRVPHDFKIQGKKTAILLSKKTATLDLTLRKGKKPYICTLPGHAAAGMKGTLTVKGA